QAARRTAHSRCYPPSPRWKSTPHSVTTHAECNFALASDAHHRKQGATRLRFVPHQLNQGLDVPEGKGERLRLALVVLNAWHVVWHDHPVVTHLLVNAQGANHVHVPVVGKRLAEVQVAAFDVAEVDIEDLAAPAEVADDIVDLFSWFLEHLG